MSLSKLLKTRIGTDEDLVSLIDAECLKRDVYSFDVIRERSDRLNEYLKRPEEEREQDEVMKLFFGLQAALYAEPPRSGLVFHPSSIDDDCERALFYTFSGIEPTNKVIRKIDGKLQRIFDVGTWWHTYIQMCLWKAGVLEKSEVDVRSKRKRIGGRCDGILRLAKGRTLLEIKTMNSYSFGRGKIMPFVKHEVQAGIYADHLGLERICFIYINKDTSEICVHFREVKDKLVLKATEKMTFVLEAVSVGKAPKRVCCAEPDDAMAKSCPFKNLCFESE